MTLPGDEQAKAVTEAAKLGQQLAESVKGLFDPALGELGEWAGSFLRGKRQLWEYKNLLALADKVRAIHAARLVEGKATPIGARQGVPLLEAVASEDEATVQDLWAGLVANATDPTQPLQIKKAYIDVLRSLDPVEAVILEGLRPLLERADPNGRGEQIKLSNFAASIQVDEQEVLLGLYHLAGLGCLRIAPAYDAIVTEQSGVDPWPAILAPPEAEFAVSALARSLLQACDPA